MMNKLKILGVLLIAIGAIIMIGSYQHWVSYDEQHNANGNYLPFVNITQSEGEFRTNVIWVSGGVFPFAGFGVLMFASIPNLFPEKKNIVKR